MTSKISEAARQKALDALEQLGGGMLREDDVIFGGDKFQIPAGLNYDSAIRFLQLRKKEEEEITSFSRTFKYRPWDGGVALDAALEKAFGSVIHKKTPGFFGPTPPALITIPTSVTDSVQVPWGPVEIPLLPGMTITPGGTVSPDDGTLFVIHAEGPRKYRRKVEGIFQLVERELEENSIYRGKAFDGKEMPEFLDLRKVDPDKIVFPQETLVQLEASVFSPIRYPDKLAELGLNSKRAVLLHGPFGTGKTSTAMLVAREAEMMNRTFVYAVPGRDNLQDVFRTARLYQPSVVFCEDLDAVSDHSDQESITSLLDMFDGFTAKNTDILAILTTNYPEKIHKGMVRPGRLDAIIHLGAPDAAGIEKLVKINLENVTLADDIEWGRVAEAMEDYLPAFVAEASQRAVRYAVNANQGDSSVPLTTEDLVYSAEGLRPQWQMMQDAPEATAADSVGTALHALSTDALNSVMSERGF